MDNGVLITETRARLHLRERRRRRLERRAGERPRRAPCSRRTRTRRRPRSEPRSTPGSASTSRSSSRTRSAGRGAGASSTWRSACPASPRSRTCAARPDADGRVMRSTVRAVADEIASAAELALGKIGRRPVAIVRGASPLRAARRSSPTPSSRPSPTCSAEGRGASARLWRRLRGASTGAALRSAHEGWPADPGVRFPGRHGGHRADPRPHRPHRRRRRLRLDLGHGPLLPDPRRRAGHGPDARGLDDPRLPGRP